MSLISWILSSILAGLAGVLIAPLFAQLDSLDFFTLLVAAIAACVIGNLTSIVSAFVGGIGLGILQAELAGFLPTDSILATGLRPGLPFAVLFVLVVFRRSARTAPRDHRSAVGRRSATPSTGGVAAASLDDHDDPGLRRERGGHRPARRACSCSTTSG